MKEVDNKKLIGLDLDGVIIDHTPLKLKLAKKFGFELKSEETHSEIIKTIIDRPILEQIKWDLYHNPEFFKSSSLMPGARSGLLRLKKRNLPFILISRRSEPKEAIETMKHHGLWPKFFNENNAFFIAEPEDKNIKAHEMSVTHFVDDEIEVLKKLTDVKDKFLFDCFNNFRGIKDYIRVASWEELMNYFVN